MTETRTCKYCGRGEAEHPDLKWHRRTQCKPCNSKRAKAKLEDENVLKTCKYCGRDSENHPELRWVSRTQCKSCSGARYRASRDSAYKTCGQCGKNSTDSPGLKWDTMTRCRPCSEEKYYGQPWLRVWRRARASASEVLGGIRHLPESLNDVEIFKKHIEEQFYSPRMTWEKFGQGRGHWQIDHILPRSNFNPKIHDPETYFGLSNLQPLWYRHNMAKSNLEPNAVRLAIDVDRVTFMVQDLPADNQIYYGVRVDQMVERFHREIENLIKEMSDETGI